MVRTRKTSNDGTVAEPEQRELFQQHKHSIRRFEILKSTPLGLVFPQNLQLELRDVDAGISLTGHSSYISSGTAPTYATSNMKWWKVGYMLPPKFNLYASHPNSKQRGKTAPASEIQGLPASPSHDSFYEEEPASKPWPLATIKYPGWQGVTQMTINMTVYQVSKWMVYDHELHAPSDIRSKWTIMRVDYRREYIMGQIGSPETGIYKWRGNKKILDIPEMDDGFPKCNGNLKLEDNDARLVAVYKQRRDSKVLGGLTVFTENLKDDVPIEVVVSSCLAIVMYERVGWQGMFGS
ncbi:uncharacterized protein A1O9_03678 [Exophiala aquamarina CBS 119918]|uniref:Phospholipid scramblase n=1 Tax=Exophiala aquamarina CBS 119918 TaxID=1182545 RepID=A0A072PTL3_9EURO|nr:uncharacterized protein A1O9_03678 [Exophiala aquamarina CBS 119918]KEF58835.1 hypothetical protein A1O9_03678 [Exophiala aquamarina CBS 119918]